ncbi:DUF4439 domain-containing protein [Cellulomonas massiliensis]|uniref:DUF4439 domain-containing protein n=1 Tax=Cellulomonas massiliensis TaxID=1465811 RepID=UPI0002DB0382|nr:DUF4439 domain-containing protein [Cellulomonas massiliensis]
MTTSPRPAAPAARRRPSAAVRAAAAGLVVLALALVAGCGVRLETPSPALPSPGLDEQVRARAVADAQQLEAGATSLLASTPADSPVHAVLDDVAAFSGRHVEELGGTWDPGVEGATPTPTAGAEPAASPADSAAVLALLVPATEHALADADAAGDGPLARLLAAVATSRAELARRLATAAGLDVPDVAAVPEPGTSADLAPAREPGEEDDDGDDASGTPEPSPTATAAGLLEGQLDPLVLAHDQAGYGYEVLAARWTGAARERAAAAATRHRGLAQAWAQVAGVDGTADDPRRVAYTLPVLDTSKQKRALARTLEAAVADATSVLVAEANPGTRAVLLDGLRRATADAAGWGAAAVAFPGMPELAQDPQG